MKIIRSYLRNKRIEKNRKNDERKMKNVYSGLFAQMGQIADYHTQKAQEEAREISGGMSPLPSFDKPKGL
jgi:hypothetical protein